jgi:hypothetical protein
MEALNRSSENKKVFNIPEKSIITGVFILGYPAVKYHKVPPRRTLVVDWK